MNDFPMADELDPEYRAMLANLSTAIDDDLPPVPTRLTQAARDAHAWRLADAQLAELLFDSANDALAGVRGSGQRRSFRFASGDHVLRVHLTESSLVLMIEPPRAATCRVVTSAESSEHVADEFGELVVDAPELPVRIEVDLPGGTVVTPWITG